MYTERKVGEKIFSIINLPFCDPFLIIEKTEGRMSGDDFWIQIER